MVQVLQAHGISQKIMAQNVGIDVKTLRKVFKPELTDGFEQVKAAMGVAVVKAGLGGSVAAQRYWLSCFGGPAWKSTQPIDAPTAITGGGNTTIIIRGGMSAAISEPPDDGEEPC